jgi:D-alanyl-D-alanine carboxypeptidase
VVASFVWALASSLVAVYFASPASAQGGPGAAQQAAPDAEAGAWVLVDEASGETLAGKNSSEELPMASTTKIMTALVTLDGTSLDEEVTVSAEAAKYARPPYSNVGLREGDKLTVRELLTAAMLESGNDAAYALAYHVGDGSVDRFVRMMNQRARDMGLQHTSFENPVGLDHPDHYSSAGDLAKMAREALSKPALREIVDTPSAVIDTAQGRDIPLQTTNELLSSYPAATGVKTGTTPAAGESLVASAARGDESYVTVMLDAADRFGSAATELEYGFSGYDRRQVIQAGRRYASEPLPSRPDQKVSLVAGEGAERLVAAGAGVERRVEVKDELPGSAEAGERLGRVTVKSGGKTVARAPLVADTGYEEASLWQRLWYTAGGIFGDGR